jgi:F-type H+-transporting ATPase subunit alpha
METNLFYQGIRPAISVGLSVSRVGSAAQTKAIKSVAKSLRIDLAQFRELAAFSQFSTDLDEETRQRIERGQRLTELLKQHQYSPLAIWEMYCSLLAATNGILDIVPVDKIKAAEEAILREIKANHKNVIESLKDGDEPNEQIRKKILEVSTKIAETYKDRAVKAGDEKTK